MSEKKENQPRRTHISHPLATTTIHFVICLHPGISTERIDLDILARSELACVCVKREKRPAHDRYYVRMP